MTTPAPCELGVTELLAAFGSGGTTPTEALADCRRAMEAGRDLGAVVTPVGDPADAAAAESDRRWADGTPRPLEGVPFGVKDNVATAGVRTTAGSLRLAGWVPEVDATAVRRLRDAGAVLVAKLATPEWAFGDAREEHAARNPWSADHWTGGSSSGPAVALAARMVPLALGTDTGGSIRVPSAYCGVAGLKPTAGRVPRDGVVPVSWTLDTIGPMARDPADLALALDVLSGPAAADPASEPRDHPPVAPSVAAGVAGLRVGVPAPWFLDRCDPAVRRGLDAVVDALVAAGARVVDVELPDPELAGTAAWVITVCEFASCHGDGLDHLDQYTPAAAERLVTGAAMSAQDYLRAIRVRADLRARTMRCFEQVDVLLTPGTPTPAPRLAPDIDPMFLDGDRMWMEAVSRNFIAFNLLGLPAVVVPSGLADDPVRPVAVQFVARPFDDVAALRAAATWHGVSPVASSAPPALTRGVAAM